ncbi:ATP-binding cassette domain-containing protein [Eisenbergiella sp.]
METTEYLLQVKNITKVYEAPGGTRTVLKDISFQIPRRELFCMMGASGSGNSTLLKILGGMETPTFGEILFDNRRMADFTPDDYEAYRQKEIGLVFQEFNLPDGLILKENILLPLTFSGTDGRTIEERYQEVIKWAGLSFCKWLSYFSFLFYRNAQCSVLYCAYERGAAPPDVNGVPGYARMALQTGGA